MTSDFAGCIIDTLFSPAFNALCALVPKLHPALLWLHARTVPLHHLDPGQLVDDSEPSWWSRGRHAPGQGHDPLSFLASFNPSIIWPSTQVACASPGASVARRFSLASSWSSPAGTSIVACPSHELPFLCYKHSQADISGWNGARAFGIQVTDHALSFMIMRR